MDETTMRQAFERDGYVVARGLFTPAECADYVRHYMALRESGTHPHDGIGGVQGDAADPLTRYPRLIQMHHWDETSRRWLLDPRLDRVLTVCLGASPLAVQTMLYFKPPGARGQALHQDQYYLRAAPGTCAAAWLALEECDEENGCLQVVPGLGHLPVLCPEAADPTVSFTDITVPLPEGLAPVPVILDAGDVLLFHGSVIHGSHPNRSTDRFRRALIGHYIAGGARQVAQFYQPALRMDGTPVEVEASDAGGPCGVWVDRDGRPAVEPAAAGRA